MPQRISIRSPFRGGARRRSIVRGGSPRRRSIVRGPSGYSFRSAYFGGQDGPGDAPETVVSKRARTGEFVDEMDQGTQEEVAQARLFRLATNDVAESPEVVNQLLSTIQTGAQTRASQAAAEAVGTAATNKTVEMKPMTAAYAIQVASGIKPNSAEAQKYKFLDKLGEWKTQYAEVTEDGSLVNIRPSAVARGYYNFQQYKGTSCLKNWEMQARPNPKDPKNPIWMCVSPQRKPTEDEMKDNPANIDRLRELRKQNAAKTRAEKAGTTPAQQKAKVAAMMNYSMEEWAALAKEQEAIAKNKNTSAYYQTQIDALKIKQEAKLKKLEAAMLTKQAKGL
jgi:hypothetical protein